MRRGILWGLLIGLLITPTIADAAIYGWRDAQGVAHYVSDVEDVPLEYREQVIKVVKDIPLAPLPVSPTEGSSARAEEGAAPAPERVSVPVETSYEWGYRAGLDATAGASQTPPVSIVQNFQFAESAPAAPYYYYYPFGPFGFFGPVLGRSHFRPHRPFQPLKPAMGSTFIQGPAGPPPLGAPGPPPVSFIRR
jgi:hypothetical protein